jgi:para-nitrobenzyl esterase
MEGMMTVKVAWMGTLAWTTVAIVLSAGTWIARAADAPFGARVRVDGGEVQGSAQDGVLSFKGIPFAAPPVGDLRWKPPQPVAAWTGVRPATAYGHDCMQLPFPSDAAPLGTEPAEDCLVLNVWRPAQQQTGKLPVLVWIYGGGFVNGGSSPAVYDGSQFAKRGLILVSFNYRVGRFGFFAHPALTKESPKGPHGNYAYLDQIAAFQWIKRNIGAFGGDPAHVTVVGESAGGMSVHMLLTSSMAKGLVQRAIVESGGGRGGLLPMRRLREDVPGGPVSAESIGVAFAKANGIEGEDAAALAALRKLPAEKVVNGLNMASMGAAAATYVGGPMIDGQILVETPEEAYKAGRNAKVPLIIGANSADIGFSNAKTIDEVLAPFGADRDKAKAAYDPDNSGNVRAVGFRVAMDRFMGEPARFVAKTLAAQGQRTYVYRFSYVAESVRKEWPGAMHATEIPYVFDTVAAKYGPKLTPQDAIAASTANAYWANFAKTGDPNTPAAGPASWAPYDARTEAILDFTIEGPKAGPDPWKARMDLTEAAATAPVASTARP